ncbi:type IV pilus biogenesis protein PilM [Paenibacillus sp. FJAT-27812]|uniref:type IV pilus biogenesis protein PilM n=1 Tax=Paenibacillus sp. FJAT-27812 TaxID=1684143 RepID=UPI0006A76E14|nr:pilus assembly protein PilM [Paenibacillus sp. FJAT-27812]
MIQSILRQMKIGSKTLGLEITDSHIKICETESKRKDVPHILKYATGVLQEGIVRDGKILNMELLHTAIKNLINEHKFSSKNVHFAIPSQMVMVRNLKLPDLSHHELKKLVQFEIKNNLAVAFEQPHYDFIKLPKKVAKETEKRPPMLKKLLNKNLGASPEQTEEPSEDHLCDVLVVAAPMDMLREYSEMFASLKLVPRSYEIKPFSILRLLEKSPIESTGLTILLDVNEANSELTIVEDGIFKITRNVEISFKALQPNTTEDNNQWISEFTSPEHTFVSAAEDLISEIERLMNFYYYTLNKGNVQFDSIMVSGSIANMEILVKALEQRMTQRIVAIDWKRLEVANDSAHWSVSSYAVSLGLALRGSD